MGNIAIPAKMSVSQPAQYLAGQISRNKYKQTKAHVLCGIQLVSAAVLQDFAASSFATSPLQGEAYTVG